MRTLTSEERWKYLRMMEFLPFEERSSAAGVVKNFSPKLKRNWRWKEDPGLSGKELEELETLLFWRKQPDPQN